MQPMMQMPSIRRGLSLFILSLCVVATAQDLSSLSPTNPDEVFKPVYRQFNLEGTVILFARSYLSLQSANQEFIFKTVSQKAQLIRVIYLPACCFDAPPVPPEVVFDARQFAIPGSRWRLTLHTTHWDWEKAACKSIQMTIPFVDEKGNVVRLEPRFQPVPGSEKESIPPFDALPCFVLKEMGWQRLPSARKAAEPH